MIREAADLRDVGGNAALDRPMATLRLAAPGLDPEVISCLFGRQPDVAAREGQRLYRSSRTRATARIATWFATTEASMSHSPSDHLAELITLITPHENTLRAMLPNLEVSFSILLPSSSSAGIAQDLRNRAEDLGRLEIQSADLHAA